MSKGFNQVILKGGLTKDPEVRYTQSGTACLRFSLACGYNVKRDGEWEEAVDYVSCKAWGSRAEYIGKYAVKGSQFFVEGKLKTDQYEGKDGKTVWDTYVLVSDVQFCGGKRKDDGGGGNAPSAPGEKYQAPDGSTWTQQDNGNWTKDEPPEPYDGPREDFSFRQGPEGYEQSDVPF